MPQVRVFVFANAVIKKTTTNRPTGTAPEIKSRLIFGVTDRSFLKTCKDEATDAIQGERTKTFSSQNLTRTEFIRI